MGRVLIIDDEPFIRMGLERFLRAHGYETTIAESGEKGLDFFRRLKPEILVVDIKMPGLSGMDILAEIKNHSPHTEVIMITAHGGMDTAIQALKQGAFSYVQKPFAFDELEFEIKRALEKQNLRKALNEHMVALENLIEEKSSELKLRIKAETALKENLNQGRLCQKKLLKIEYPKVFNMRFYSQYIPYDIVGGDIYNIIQLGNKILFYLSDLAGHGIQSAILSAFIKAKIDHYIKMNRIFSPAELIKLLKDSLQAEEIFYENMLTIFIGVVDITALEFTYSSAGHFLPFIFSSGEKNKYKFTNIVNTQRPIMNIFKSEDYKDMQVTLKNNTKILLFSDGFVEWLDEQGKIVGITGLKKYIAANGMSEEGIQSFLERGIKYHQKDDISYVLIDISTSYRKSYFCNLMDYDRIIKDFEQEIEARYASESLINRASQCFGEVVINAIEHGNKNDPDKQVSINVEFAPEAINFSVADEGPGFDHEALNFSKSISAKELRGRGLFLVRLFSDKLEFNRTGNEVRASIVV